MGITINLTEVLITAIICLTICLVFKISKDKEIELLKAEYYYGEQDEKPDIQKNNVIEVPCFGTKEEVKQGKRLVEYVEEQARKKGDIEP